MNLFCQIQQFKMKPELHCIHGDFTRSYRHIIRVADDLILELQDGCGRMKDFHFKENKV